MLIVEVPKQLVVRHVVGVVAKRMRARFDGAHATHAELQVRSKLRALKKLFPGRVLDAEWTTASDNDYATKSNDSTKHVMLQEVFLKVASLFTPGQPFGTAMAVAKLSIINFQFFRFENLCTVVSMFFFFFFFFLSESTRP